MNINRQFQSLHTGEYSNKWVLKQIIERDICYLYHQLSSYSYIMGDLYFGEVYNLPYWEYLDVESLDLHIDDNERDFIIESCLVMILTMAWEQIDGAGCYINNKVDKILQCLKSFIPKNEKQIELQRIALNAVDLAANSSNELDEQVYKESIWVHKEFIRNYFRHIVYDFDNNSYFKE
jgi:hypothetical protein